MTLNFWSSEVVHSVVQFLSADCVSPNEIYHLIQEFSDDQIWACKEMVQAVRRWSSGHQQWQSPCNFRTICLTVLTLHHHTTIYVSHRETLEVTKFQSNENVEVTVHKWLQMSVPNVYHNWIFTLMSRWNICIYMIENYYVLKIRILHWWHHFSDKRNYISFHNTVDTATCSG